MRRQLKPKEAAARADKLAGWLQWISELYSSVDIGAAGDQPAGFDADPRLRPCEHRAEWYRGGLCLACENTGWRKATKKERGEGMAFDPYAFELPKSQWRVLESESSVRAREGEHLDAIIARCQRDERIRAGKEAKADRSMSAYLQVQQFPAGYGRVRRGLMLFQSARPHAYDRLPQRAALEELARFMWDHVPGKILEAPTS